MKSIGPGLAIRIFDYSENPRELLRGLTEPLTRLKSAQQLPVVHLRRGWLHGSHLQVTARPYEGREVVAAEFAAQAGALAAARNAETPTESAYLTRAQELARWENVREELLPRHPQGFVDVRAALPRLPAQPELSLASEQIMGRFLEPVLASAAVPDALILPHLAQVMAVLARSHPRGISAGALPYRSHAEGISSATGNHLDLKSRFAARFDTDQQVFFDALNTPLTDPALLLWQSAIQYAWGVAEALAAGGHLTERTLADAVGEMEMPLGTPVRSDFIGEVLGSALIANPSYRHIAHRVVLNVLYACLTCFGITPVQRYYLCYGISEATDRLLGQDSIARVREFSRELA
jgi:hypothetical protein